MSKDIKDSAGYYQLFTEEQKELGEYHLRFDRGTLLLEGNAPILPGVESFFRYDPRVDAYRAPAYHYAQIIGLARRSLSSNQAPRYKRLDLVCALPFEPYPHQREALNRWQAAQGRGLIVLPTGAGKTLVGLLALCWAKRDGLILVPTLDLMHQWYALLQAAFPQQEIGLIGGGYHEVMPLTIATYDSASRHIDRLGNRFGLLIFDEVHHLPSEFYRSIAEFSLAPYRLGLTATLERSDGRHEDLADLVGPLIYQKRPDELTGDVLAPFQIRPILVELSAEERETYRKALEKRNQFLQVNRISLRTLEGWNRFIMASAKSPEGRRAMQAHREARHIAHATGAKLRALAAILENHAGEKTVIFTEDNATAYEVSRRFLIPCMTHQTKIKERQHIIECFRDGIYTALVSSNVLNEGVDIPDASIGIILSGSASAREFIQRLGRILRRKQDKQAILYEVVSRETREERVAEQRRPPSSSAARPGQNLSLFSQDESG